MDKPDDYKMNFRPTALRPLLGMTVLVVEDSRFSCDALRLLCIRSGARIRRADCLRSARRHLEVYQPSILIVDLGLPDGNGAELISELSASVPRVPAILGTSGDAFAENIAISAGADGFLPKPFASVAGFQACILQALPADLRPQITRMVMNDTVFPDPIAYRDDMEHVAQILSEADQKRDLDYVLQFLSGVALSANDDVMSDAVDRVKTLLCDNRSAEEEVIGLSRLVQSRLEEQIAL